MKTLLVTLLMVYAPFALSFETSNITKTRSLNPEPTHQAEDREGEDDPGILSDAKKGDIGAQFAYGMIQYGKGNYKVAADWYLKAANKNHQRARYELGKMYVKGLGVPVNYQRAYFLFTISEEQGYTDSTKAKASLMKLMSPAQIKSAQTMVNNWYRKQ